MKEFNKKQFAELLESEGFINAVKRFKEFAERKHFDREFKSKEASKTKRLKHNKTAFKSLLKTL